LHKKRTAAWFNFLRQERNRPVQGIGVVAFVVEEPNTRNQLFKDLRVQICRIANTTTAIHRDAIEFVAGSIHNQVVATLCSVLHMPLMVLALGLLRPLPRLRVTFRIRVGCKCNAHFDCMKKGESPVQFLLPQKFLETISIFVAVATYSLDQANS